MSKIQNDPAATAIAPGHGSINPEKVLKMNNATTTTAQPERPARPSDREVAAALYEVDCDLTDLRRAATVLDEYITYEFRAARDSRAGVTFPYTLNQSQAEGIFYMAMHVRDLAAALERRFDAAFGREASQ